MNIYSLLFFFFFLIFIGAFSFLINGTFLKYSKNLGMRNIDEKAIRWAAHAKPALGGISFYMLFLISIVFHELFLGSSSTISDNIPFIGLIIASTLSFMMGLADDAYNTKPLLKLLVQISCGIILIMTNTYIKIFSLEIFNYIITVLWVVGMMNSINMLDNMDAISGTITVFILACIFIVIINTGEAFNIYSVITVGVMGAIIGFLFYNFNPASLYMGDTGSQFLGLLLSALSIKYLWNFDNAKDISQNLVIVAIVFLIPLTDTLTVIINRMLKGNSPFVGGKDHTTHFLNYRGLSERMVWFTFVFLSSLSILFVWIILYKINHWSYFHFIEYTLYGLLVFGLLFINTRLRKKEIIS